MLYVAQVKKKAYVYVYALPSVLNHGKNKQTVISKYGQLVTTLLNKTVNSLHDHRL